MKAFFRASGTAKPAERLEEWAIYVIEMSCPPVIESMADFSRLSLLRGGPDRWPDAQDFHGCLA
jgi:hypothetical protein